MNKICFVNHKIYPYHSGAGLFALRLSNNLLEFGYKIKIITLSRNNDNTQKFKFYGNVPIYRIPTHFTKLSYCDIEAGLKLSQLYKSFNHYDIVHCFNSSGFLECVAGYKAHKIGKKYIFEISLLGGDDPITLSKTKLGSLKLKIIKKADAIIVKTKGANNILINNGFNKDPIYHIPYGVDTTTYKPIKNYNEKLLLRQKLKLPQTSIILCNIGAIIKRKNQIELINIINNFKSIFNQQFILLLIGPYNSNDQYYINLKKLIIKYNLEKNVIFTGYITNTHEYLRASDIFIMTSINEGLPNALIEAMSSGLPCIVNNIMDVMSDIIIDGYDGFIVNNNEVFETCRLIKKIIDDKYMYMKIRNNAILKIKKNFSSELITKKYIDLYNNIL